ncbi:hypothetical protein T191209_092 [Synechococcus phage S-CAM22]|uniref:DUF6321 domain-containing protein n=1 Tax=Synechococcus phage S-CAM22 TaxID=1883365 RepID=A0A1D8KQQ8_9CAUD|nr:hypothetical protein BOW88_gp139 [Synechococcus phage S-CAM22]YP_010088753.1 hypothetical protein KNT15_gp139 [Synechococcus phage S-CAM22]AOV60924.1 hypothetical protein C350210_092 [Synechococcus phage S-CAM22]AOV61138.1 hypothetical protein N440310_092 [Synechococcus phage S-CAM22]AOV61352.1 hypothetical protein T191209_092 [Synechococcus phage S-CAM22]
MAEGFKSDIPPAINSTAKKYIRGMMKGKSRWAKLYGRRDKEVMHKTANKMAMGEMQKMPPTYNDVFGGINEKAVSKKQQRFFGMVRAAQKGEMENPSPEVSKVAAAASVSDVKKFAKTKHKGLPMKKDVKEANKSGDSSLRDWFGKSKSSDGKPGWVQLGGKYAGKPCAKQPGQTTKPKCGSSKMKRNLNKDEEEAAFRRKNAKDPNPDRKGKAINVKTEETQIEETPKYDKQGYDKFDRYKRMVRHKQDKYGVSTLKQRVMTGADHNIDNEKKSKMKEDTINERGDYWHPDPDKDRKLGGPGANQRAREDRAAASKPKSDPKKLKPGESYMDYAKRQKGYSSAKPKKKSLLGRLGLKKEEVQQEGVGNMVIKAIDKTKPPYLSKRAELVRKIKQKQLDSYLKKVDKKKKERVTNVGMGEAVEWLTEEQFDEAAGEKDACYKKVKSRYKVWPSAYASGALVKCRKVGAANWGNSTKESITYTEFQEKCWQGYEKKGMKTMFGKRYPNCVKKTKKEEVEHVDEKAKACWDTHKKVGMKMKGGKLVNDCRPKNEEVTNEGAAWTKKSGKNSEGGLNEKGRKSYERENPGSDLKAPSKKVGNPRRASFCARMKGMRKRQKPSNNTGDDRLSKSLRKWNC